MECDKKWIREEEEVSQGKKKRKRRTFNRKLSHIAVCVQSHTRRERGTHTVAHTWLAVPILVDEVPRFAALLFPDRSAAVRMGAEMELLL